MRRRRPATRPEPFAGVLHQIYPIDRFYPDAEFCPQYR